MIAFQRADYATAEARYREALAIYANINDTTGQSATLANLGRIYSVRKAWEQALSLYRSGLSLAERMGDRAGLAAALGNIGETLRELGELDDAERTLSRAIGLLQSLGDTAGITRIQEELRLIRLGRDERERSIAGVVGDAQRLLPGGWFPAQYD